jgi:hypothetical protein
MPTIKQLVEQARRARRLLEPKRKRNVYDATEAERRRAAENLNARCPYLLGSKATIKMRKS